MKEEWLMPGAVVPVDPDTTKALVDEIKRLIGTIGDMALQQAEKRQSVGLTDDEREEINRRANASWSLMCEKMVAAEREACAKVCEGWDFVPGGHEFTPQQLTKNLTETIAAHIRKRGNT